MKRLRGMITAVAAAIVLVFVSSGVSYAGYIYVKTLKKGTETAVVWEGTPSGFAYVSYNGSRSKTRLQKSPAEAIRWLKKNGYK